MVKPTPTAIAAVALVVCAWFALGLRQAVATDQATAIISGNSGLSAGDARHASSLLGEAALLNPDSTVDVLRAQLAESRGDDRRAERILLNVLRREPMNITAWYALASVAASAHDFRTTLLAVLHIGHLEPIGPKPKS